MPEITITKLEAAHRQLRTAIALWFTDGDPVSTHALVFAAHQVLQDLMRREKRTPQLAFNLSHIKPEYRKEIDAKLKEAGYFIKHGDRGKAGMLPSISFNPTLTGLFIVYTMSGLRYYKQDISAEEMTFDFWHVIHEPQLLTDAGKNIFKDSYGIEMTNALRTVPKGEFFEHACDFFRKHQR